MKELETLSNNEILFKIKQYEADHEALKLKMLQDYDKLEQIEKEYQEAAKLIAKRLKGEQ